MKHRPSAVSLSDITAADTDSCQSAGQVPSAVRGLGEGAAGRVTTNTKVESSTNVEWRHILLWPHGRSHVELE